MGSPHGWASAYSPGLARSGCHGTACRAPEPPRELLELGNMISKQLRSGNLHSFTVSSCFSGIGTAELCARVITASCKQKGMPVEVKPGMGFEIDATARSLLHTVTEGTPCCNDLLSLWPPPVRERLEQGFTSFMELRQFLEGKASLMSDTFTCCHTGKRVSIDLGDAHCGGNPCKDWSSFGKKQGLLGPTAPVMITWALLIRRHQPALVIQENVPSFPIAILLDLLNGLYRVETLILDPRRLGWPVARKRQYALFTSQSRLQSVSLSTLSPLLDAVAHVGDATLFAVSRVPVKPLSERECANLDQYKALARSDRPQPVVDLSQNPLARPRGSTVDGALCTLTCSSSRLFVISEARCLSGIELLLAQGFPATDWAAGALGIHTGRLTPDGLSNHAAVRLAGNAMHSNCMGLMLAWSLFVHLIPWHLQDGVPVTGERKVRFRLGKEVLRPPPAASSDLLFARELDSFVRHSQSPVACSLRTPAVPGKRPRQRDIFPLPDLLAQLVDGLPEILRQQARLCIAGLNVLWAGGTVTPFATEGPTVAQRAVHSLVLRRSADWLNRMLKVEPTYASAQGAWMDFETATVTPPLKLRADLVDLPEAAGTCDPWHLLGDELRHILENTEDIAPKVAVGHGVHTVPRHSRLEYVRLTVRELRLGKLVLEEAASGLGTIFPVPKKGDRQRAVWHGTLVSEASERPVRPRRLGNPAALLALDWTAGTRVRWSKRDAASFFDTLLCPPSMRTWFGRPPVSISELVTVGGMSLGEVRQCCGNPASITPTQSLFPCSRVWPMGYSWSSAVAQDVSLGLLWCAGFREEQVLCVEEPLHPTRLRPFSCSPMTASWPMLTGRWTTLRVSPRRQLPHVWHALTPQCAKTVCNESQTRTSLPVVRSLAWAVGSLVIPHVQSRTPAAFIVACLPFGARRGSALLCRGPLPVCLELASGSVSYLAPSFPSFAPSIRSPAWNRLMSQRLCPPRS